MTTTEFTVTGMSCAHCERSVAEEVGAIDGVTIVKVSAPENTLVIASETPVVDAAVIAAVKEAGYVAVRAA